MTTNFETVVPIITTLLQQGVPTNPIAIAFNVDQSLVKELQAEIKISQYGSSEIAELLQSLMFEAYQEARQQIKSGSPATKTRMIQMILSRAMVVVGKQSPEEFERLRRELQSTFAEMTNNNNVVSMFPDPTFSPIGGMEESDEEIGT